MTEITQELLNELAGILIDGYEVYEPAIARMTMAEMRALRDLLSRKKLDDAYNEIADKMTIEDLAAEKVKLRAVTELRASARYEAIELGNNILLAVLKGALGFVLAAGVV